MIISILFLWAFIIEHASASMLDVIKNRGFIKCGVSTGVPGFSQPDSSGNWKGFDVDFCKAIAAAIFNNPSKVKYLPLSTIERFIALQSGDVDILSRNTTYTLSRNTSLHLSFHPITYYDGQGFLVKKKLNIKSALELSDVSICTWSGTTDQLNASDYFKSHNIAYKIFAYDKEEEAISAYEGDRCDVYTTDQSALYTSRLTLKKPDEHIILPEIISKEPLAPAVLENDTQWINIISWVHFALVNAEEFGITKENVDKMLNSDEPAIKRFLGREPRSNLGSGLGLTEDWAYRIIKSVGNYGEIFESNLGSGSPFKIPRNYNNLWKKGGLQYAPPVL
nr:amino acid ABC transporter substrate-binding protein [Liberibacter crescens]